MLRDQKGGEAKKPSSLRLIPDVGTRVKYPAVPPYLIKSSAAEQEHCKQYPYSCAELNPIHFLDSSLLQSAVSFVRSFGLALSPNRLVRSHGELLSSSTQAYKANFINYINNGTYPSRSAKSYFSICSKNCSDFNRTPT